MSERKSRSDRAGDFEQASEQMQRAFGAAVVTSGPARISISKNVTRFRSRIGAMQGALQSAHQGLISIGAYVREHRSEIEALLDHFDETHCHVENAKLLPENHVLRRLWQNKIGRLPLGRYVEEELPFLQGYKKPPARRGRPKGTGPIVSDEALLAELDVLVMAGMKPTTAAIALLRKRGVPGELKSRADYLVKRYRAAYPKAQKISPNKTRGKNQPR